MTLTVGSGPFGDAPAGRFNFAVPGRVEYLEPFPRRVRAFAAGETVVDSAAVRLLHRRHRLPVWCFPREDVRLEALGAAAEVFDAGLAEGLVHVRWDAADRWLEEDEEVIVHPRDPYHRVEPRATSRLVRVSLDGERLAESSAALAVFETSLPPRWYLPREDVAAELRPNAQLRTGCAYKGWAGYFDVRVGERFEPFLAWHYPQPLAGMERLRDRVCFFNERVDLEIDGEPQERPLTQWSGTDWAGGAQAPP